MLPPSTASALTSVRGIVTDLLGQTVAGAMVVLADAQPAWGCGVESGQSEPRVAYSAGEGEFLFEGAPFGSYSLVASTEEATSRVEPIKLLESEPTVEVLAILMEAAALEGVVVTLTGEPVPGALLTTIGFEKETLDGEYGAVSAVSDASGAFRFFPLLLGRWRLAVCAPGFAPLITEWYAPPRAGLRLVLGTPGTLHGKVALEGSGAPLAGVKVQMRLAAVKMIMQETVTGAAGDFEFSEVGEGNCVLSLDDPAYTIAAGGGRVKVSPAESPVTLTARQAGVVRGIFFDAAKQPLAGASASAVAEGGMKSHSEVSGPNGAYEITGLPAGRITVTPLYRGRSVQVPEARFLTLLPGAVSEGVDFHFTGGTIAGRVIHEDGRPAPGAEVLAIGGMGEPLTGSRADARADEAGYFTFIGLGAVFSWRVSASTTHSTSLPVGPVDLSDEHAQQLEVVLNVPQTGQLSGVVLTDRNEPCRGRVWLDISAEGQDLPTQFVPTDTQGRFAAPVPARAHIAFQVNSNPLGRQMSPPRTPTPAEIDFRADTFSPPLYLRVPSLAPGERIAGTVLDPLGDPVFAASVTARCNGAVEASMAMTDMDGWFEFTNLNSGLYELLAGDSGYPLVRLSEVSSGTTDLVLQFSPRSVLRGWVVDAATQAPLKEFELALVVPIINNPRDQHFERFSSVDGAFEFPLQGAGERSLVCRAPGYERQFVPVVINEGEEPPEMLIELARIE